MPERAIFSRIFCRALLLLSAGLLATGCNLPTSDDGTEIARVISGPPQVRLVAPLDQSRYLAGVNVNILAAVANAGADINRVEVSVGGEVIATLPEPNPSGGEAFSIAQTWPAAVGEHQITVVAYRADGSASAPAEVRLSVVAELPVLATATPTATPTEAAPTASPTPQPTDTPIPTAAAPPTAAEPSPQPTASGPRVISRGVNVRRGPGTNFEPPIGVLAIGDTADILGLNLAEDWLKIRFGTGEGWVLRSIVDVEGSLAGLPREAGPPTPVPPPPTAPPVNDAPPGGQPPVTGGANLIVENFVLDPRDPFCNQPAQARINIGNIGDQATGTGGFVVLIAENTDGSNRQVLGAAEIPSINAGARNFLVVIDFRDTNLSNRGDGVKRVIVSIDPNGQIPETSKADNIAQGEYALGVPCQ